MSRSSSPSLSFNTFTSCFVFSPFERLAKLLLSSSSTAESPAPSAERGDRSNGQAGRESGASSDEDADVGVEEGEDRSESRRVTSRMGGW